jgi:uncharacterized membrane protein
MIETHVMNALLLPSIKDEAPFKVLTFINGLVAPSFLFCAGLAFAITIQRKWEMFLTPVLPFWRYIVRMVFILVVAYSLHLPKFSFSQLRVLDDPQAWIPFYQSDILQIIALTLLSMAFLAAIVRKRELFIYSISVIAMPIIFLSPIVRDLDYTNTAAWLRPYLSMQYKSQFPIFPWSAFLMCGAIVGYWYLGMREQGREKQCIQRLALFATIGIGLSFLFEFLPVTFYPNHDFWRASPEFFFVRFGIVVLALSGVWWFEQKRKASSRSMISLFGQESLLVYVVHLLIVYGHTYDWSFIRVFGKTLNYAECFGLTAVLIVGMYVMAYAWHWMKGRNKNVATVVEYLTLGGIVVAFFLK